MVGTFRIINNVESLVPLALTHQRRLSDFNE